LLLLGQVIKQMERNSLCRFLQFITLWHHTNIVVIVSDDCKCTLQISHTYIR